VYGNYIDEVIQIRDHTQPTPEDFFAHQDDLFSVYAITDAAGGVTQRYLYGDYGTRVTTDPAGTAGFEPALEVEHGFTGRLHDETSGLIEYRHRWMRPEMGRFVQRDPLWYVDGMNMYRYAMSRPHSAMDATGLACSTPCYDTWLRAHLRTQCYNQYGPLKEGAAFVYRQCRTNCERAYRMCMNLGRRPGRRWDPHDPDLIPRETACDLIRDTCQTLCRVGPGVTYSTLKTLLHQCLKNADSKSRIPC